MTNLWHSFFAHHLPTERLEKRVRTLASLLLFFAPLICASAVLSFSFPFSRPFWQANASGATGFANTLLLFFIFRYLRKMSLPAAFAGLGISLHEIIINLWACLELSSRRGLTRPEETGFIVNLACGAAGAAFFLYLIIIMLRYIKLVCNRIHISDPLSEDQKAKLRTTALATSALAYTALFAAVFITFRFRDDLIFPYMKWIVEFGLMFSMIGAGQEVGYVAEEVQSAAKAAVKTLSHLLVLAALLFLVYSQLGQYAPFS